MRVMTLGQVASGIGSAPLPSSDSTLSALRGEPGGWGKVLWTTALRALILAPGVWVGGGRGWRLVSGSLVASVSITAFLFIWHAAHEGGREEATSAPGPTALPAPGPAALPESTNAPTLEGLGRWRRVR